MNIVDFFNRENSMEAEEISYVPILKVALFQKCDAFFKSPK